MSVSSTTNRVTYAGNGVTTAFSFPYYFQATSDLVVKGYNTSTGAVTSYTLTTDYTVSGTFTSNQGYLSGGTVTMLVAPATGITLVIYRDVTLTQTLTLVDNDIVPATSVNAEFDKVTLIAQRTREMASRSVRLADGFAGTFSTTLPTPVVASAVLVSDATGTFLSWGAAGSGSASVSSVGLTAPAIFSVSGSPVTSSGTLAMTLANQSANTFFAGLTSGTGTPAFRAIAASDISANLITNALSAQMATNTIKGNNTGGTANASDLTVAQVAAILPAVVGDSGSGGTKGLVPAPAAGDAAASRFLKADGTWAAPAGAGTVTSASVVSANGFAGSVANPTSTPAITLTTSVTGMLKGNATAISAGTAGTDYSAGTSALGTGILKSTTTTGALTIAVAGDFPTLNQNTSGSAASVSGTNIVTNSNLSQMAANTIKGNNTGSTANATDLTVTQTQAMLAKIPAFTTYTSQPTQTGWMFTCTSFSATAGATYTNNGNTYTVLGTYSALTLLFCSNSAAPLASGTLTKATGTGDATITFSTRQATSTYTPTSGCAFVIIELNGGGGGGAGSGTAGQTVVPAAGLGSYFYNPGTTNGVSFAFGGNGSSGNVLGGGGGGGGNAAGTAIFTFNGGGGGAGGTQLSTQTTPGGVGAASFFGGSGLAGTFANAGGAGVNGGGGGGAGMTNGTAGTSGGGGGSGAYIKFAINAPSGTFPFAVGSGGAGGTAGTTGFAGGAGGGGVVTFTEYFI